MTARTKTRTQGATTRLRTFKAGGSYAAYEAAKSAWDSVNHGADFRTREQAMRRFAKAFGV